jgi:tetratricopeptide (TPR) repeat protein
VILSGACALVGCKPGFKMPEMTASESEAIAVNKSLELVTAAQRLETAGKKQEAIAKYYEAIREYRATPQAWNNLGRLLMEEGANMEAATPMSTGRTSERCCSRSSSGRCPS